MYSHEYENFSPFAIEDILDIRLGDDVVITLEPVVPLLPYVGSVVTSLQWPDMIYHSKQRIPLKKLSEWPQLDYSNFNLLSPNNEISVSDPAAMSELLLLLFLLRDMKGVISRCSGKLMKEDIFLWNLEECSNLCGRKTSDFTPFDLFSVILLNENWQQPGAFSWSIAWCFPGSFGKCCTWSLPTSLSAPDEWISPGSRPKILALWTSPPRFGWCQDQEICPKKDRSWWKRRCKNNQISCKTQIKNKRSLASLSYL